MISYRHYKTYQEHQQGLNSDQPDDFRAASYQRYQGLKLWRRFEPTAYYVLSMSMDSHDLGRGRGTSTLVRKEAKKLLAFHPQRWHRSR